MRHLSEEQLALHAGGDLLPAEVEAITSHLQDCLQCQAVLADFRENRACFESAMTEPSGDDLRDVRLLVIRRLERQKGVAKNWRWLAATAAAVAMIVVLLCVWRLPRNTINSRSATTAELRIVYQPLIEPFLPNLELNTRRVQTKQHRSAPGIRKVTLLAERNGPPILKMTTSDPDVVILWQLDERTQRHD